MEQVHKEKPDQNGNETGEQIEEKHLAAESAKGPLIANPRDPGND
jgi:hypothetical protein